MFRGRAHDSGKVVGMYESKKVKRYRSAFTTNQIYYLEKQFEKCPYIGSATRKEVANLLSIPERAIKIWFQNRRMKEKKETNNKEFNIDRCNNLTNNMEFAKDSLNNVHSLQSANDSQCSLQSTISKHVGITNCKNYYDSAEFSNRSRVDHLKKETIDNRKPCKYNSNIGNKIKQDVEKAFVSEHANLMKYNSNNDYNNKDWKNYLELNKKGVTKGKVMQKTALKSESFRDLRLNIPPTMPRYQDLPEDLSARSLSNVIVPQNHQGNINLSPAYIPFCNTQDVCLSAGNVIWKPVSVMPALSPNPIPVNVPERPRIDQNNQKCKCSCSCNSRSRLNYDQGAVEPQPQYVIAIPYNDNLNMLR